MLVSEILTQSVVHKEMSIDPVYGRTHLNEAMGILAMMFDSAKVRSTSTIVCADEDIEYVLPTGCITVLKVFDSKGEEYNKLFYQINNGYISFQDIDTYTITTLGKAPSVTLNTETPAIADLYHRTLAKYITYRELISIKPDMATLYKNEFYQESGTINTALTNAKRRGRYTPVRQFR